MTDIPVLPGISIPDGLYSKQNVVSCNKNIIQKIENRLLPPSTFHFHNKYIDCTVASRSRNSITAALLETSEATFTVFCWCKHHLTELSAKLHRKKRTH